MILEMSFIHFSKLLSFPGSMVFIQEICRLLGLLSSQMVKESACDGGDPAVIPGLGRIPDERNDYPFQYSCLDNPMARAVSRAAVRGAPTQTGRATKCMVMEEHTSAQFSHSVVSDSLWLQHARPRCPSPPPGVYSNTCPFSWRCHPAISSSVVPFSSCPLSFPPSGSF